MPPKKKLSAAEIAGLVKWVEKGAPDPRPGKKPARGGSELNIEGKYTSGGPAILGPARIGSWDGGGRDYEGEIDEFVIFNTALSATHIKSIATKSLATILSGDTSVDAVGKATAVWAKIRAVY